MKTAVVGGGAAGFFLAINLKEMCPEMQVSIFERSARVLRKVELSGGGRCNCTNSFQGIGSDLQSAYPRGHRLLKRLFRQFSPADAYQWFEHRGVKLVTQADHCVFPQTQDAHTIVNLFLAEAHRLNIEVLTNKPVGHLEQLSDYDYVCIATGGLNPHGAPVPPAFEGHTVEKPVPSLFSFSIADPKLTALMGTVAEQASAMIPATKLRASGPLLITHWGMSGPCILRLSSYAARVLSQAHYQQPLAVNWTGQTEGEVQQMLADMGRLHPQKQLTTVSPPALPGRLWDYLLQKSLGGRAHAPWASLNQKELNRLTNILTNDNYQISGRAPFKDEFVTCGGVALSAINPATLESRTTPHLYFAGEVLDIDGITGGFNFQAAWTTAYSVATAIAKQEASKR